MSSAEQRPAPGVPSGTTGLAWREGAPDDTSALAAQLVREARRAERRRRLGVVNRRLAWLVLPVLVPALLVHYAPGGDSSLNHVVLVLQLVFVPLVLVHTAMSFYVFGWVAPTWTLRTVHVWVGYVYLVAMLASQTTFAWPAVHRWLTVVMFVCLAVHVAIGARFAARRRQAAAHRVRL